MRKLPNFHIFNDFLWSSENNQFYNTLYIEGQKWEWCAKCIETIDISVNVKQILIQYTHDAVRPFV